MPKLYNADPHPQIVNADEPATQPGEPRDFTPTELENGIAGNWVKTDPRSGLAAERAFKAKRDKQAPADPSPAEPSTNEAPGDPGQKE
jgi:hypothetical protein